jgi:hypothetical protein
MALMTVDSEGPGISVPKPRWPAGKKMEVVLRLLRGEKLESLSRELGVEAHRIAAWRNEFIDAGKDELPLTSVVCTTSQSFPLGSTRTFVLPAHNSPSWSIGSSTRIRADPRRKRQ